MFTSRGKLAKKPRILKVVSPIALRLEIELSFKKKISSKFEILFVQQLAQKSSLNQNALFLSEANESQ